MDRIIEVKVCGNHLTKDSNLAGVQYEANARQLRITFDEGWSGFSKTVTFYDAKGQTSVERMLTSDLLEDITESLLTYLVPIPGEAMTYSGWCSFVIDGYLDGARQRSFSAELEVRPAPAPRTLGASDTPNYEEQFQAQMEDILGTIQGASQSAKEAKLSERAAAESAAAAEEQAGVLAGLAESFDMEELREKYSFVAGVSDRLETKGGNGSGMTDDLVRNNVEALCRSYVDHAAEFCYGHSTAFSQDVVKSADGKWRINCSALTMLVTLGIPFEKSKYNNLTENTMTDAGCMWKDLYDWFCFPKGTEFTMYASQHLGEWLYFRGYTFEPNADFSNVETGDIVFWNNDTANDTPGRWRGIDHSCIMGRKYQDGRAGMWEVSGSVDGGEGGPRYHVYGKQEIASRVILCARLPKKLGSYAPVKVFEDRNPVKITDNTSNRFYLVRLPKPLELGKMYTLYVEAELGADDYVFVRNANNTSLYSGSGKHGIRKNIIPIITTDTVENANTLLSIHISTTNIPGCALKRVALYEGIKEDGFENNLPSETLPYYDLAAQTDTTFGEFVCKLCAGVDILGKQSIFLRLTDSASVANIGGKNWQVDIEKYMNGNSRLTFSSYQELTKTCAGICYGDSFSGATVVTGS